MKKLPEIAKTRVCRTRFTCVQKFSIPHAVVILRKLFGMIKSKMLKVTHTAPVQIYRYQKLWNTPKEVLKSLPGLVQTKYLPL